MEKMATWSFFIQELLRINSSCLKHYFQQYVSFVSVRFITTLQHQITILRTPQKLTWAIHIVICTLSKSMLYDTLGNKPYNSLKYFIFSLSFLTCLYLIHGDCTDSVVLFKDNKVFL